LSGHSEFASPEQSAGIGVDIRSDLYSLGVTLWVMVTGQTPFRGTAGEVMHQHQHAPLPLEQLKDIPQPDHQRLGVSAQSPSGWQSNKFSQFRFSRLEIGRLAYSKVAASGFCRAVSEGRAKRNGQQTRM
jgi:serine/threonine protein kinase